jgi:hypothetical protein
MDDQTNEIGRTDSGVRGECGRNGEWEGDEHVYLSELMRFLGLFKARLDTPGWRVFHYCVFRVENPWP